MIRRHLLLAATSLLAAGCASPNGYVLFPSMRAEPLYQWQPPGTTFDREYETPFGPLPCWWLLVTGAGDWASGGRHDVLPLSTQ